MNEKDKELLKSDKLRTNLAIRRTMMSCERSLLSYIRTACVFVSLAFTYLKIAAYDKFDTFVIIMFCIGLFFLVFGIIEYFLVKHRTRDIYKNIDIKYIEEETSHED